MSTTKKNDCSTITSTTPPPINVPTLVIAGTHSGVGKTTIASGLMAAFTRRGLVVQPFKVGPDFLDGMHHETACNDVPRSDNKNNDSSPTCLSEETNADSTSDGVRKIRRRPSINLDGWMMGPNDDDEAPHDDKGQTSASSSKDSILSSFHRHAAGADLCIIEGVMGLHDGKHGISDDGSTAQIAKWLQAPVVLVVDAHSMARSVAAMVLGYLALDTKMRLAAVVVNKVQGSRHIEWIQQALKSHHDRLVDVGTKLPVLFAGAMPKDKQVAIPERHLGLVMPQEKCDQTGNTNSSDSSGLGRFIKLAAIVEAHLDLDDLLRVARTATPPLPATIVLSNEEKGRQPTTALSVVDGETSCRIGIAYDAAFNFYYHDNLSLLEQAGAELVYFSPLNDSHLPPQLDALYFGGGYPELHADPLQANGSLRLDIQSFALAGGVIYAECGGLMYMAEALWTMTRTESDASSKNGSEYNRRRYGMCGVLPGVTISMTPHMKMYYAQVQMNANPIFQEGTTCRGQKFHFSEVIEDSDSQTACQASSPYSVTPQTPGSIPEASGYTLNNVVASYFHLHWASRPSMAREFVDSAMRTSPFRKGGADAYRPVVSFVSAATEICFALGVGDSMLAGVTSVCDFPPRARAYPRQVVCQSPFDASQMTSEEVAAAMKDFERRKSENPKRPGHWLVDSVALGKISPRVAFVQESCDICDAARSDVLGALQDCGALSQCKIVQISPNTLNGMLQSIMDVGEAMGVAEISAILCNELKTRLQQLAEKVAKKEKKRPRVLSLEGLSPLCVGGGWLPDVKASAGCDDALGDIGGAPARIISWDEIAKADPDVLVISPCSASTERTLNELYLLNTPEFWNLRCVRFGDVYVIDHGMFSRPGPRLVDGAEMLATLLLGVDPPEQADPPKDYDALKYECCVGKVKHCTTELSWRFRHCFRGVDSSSSCAVIRNPEGDEESLCSADLAVYRIKTTPGSSTMAQMFPCDRSAHNVVSLKDGSVLVFGGEDDVGKRYSDVWKLHISSKLYSSSTRYDGLDRLYRPMWELLQCTRVADEDVPTARSNSAAVVCGDYLLVFGGWGQESQCLDHCELLHLETLCWTHCSTREGKRPCPRGNPTLVYSDKLNSAILFGGWDKTTRLSDLWQLDMDSWKWYCHGEYRGDHTDNNQPLWPQGRTDHSAVLWTKDNGEEYIVVFGGSCAATGSHSASAGPCSEVWILDTNSWAWRILQTPQDDEKAAPVPVPRTSHAATLVGSGVSARMLVMGGTGTGSGPNAITADAWILELYTMSWTKLDLAGMDNVPQLLGRCRHTMTTASGGGGHGEERILVWGGYDGVAAVENDASIWFGGAVVKSETKTESSTRQGTSDNQQHTKRLQERWQAEIPLRESDLPADVLAKAQKSTLPGAVYKALHRHAVTLNRDTYIDPASGYSVFTQVYLKRRPCCGNGCRHCPHGHVNCRPKPSNSNENVVKAAETAVTPLSNCNEGCDDPDLDW